MAFSNDVGRRRLGRERLVVFSRGLEHTREQLYGGLFRQSGPLSAQDSLGFLPLTTIPQLLTIDVQPAVT